ncbi:signal transduction histidine kinase [Saccharothrix saharensis]|uniref:histidine kinase n=1 Tax=Saccharothrix saharensis TaxID=571190 RepID=A0A543JAE3_9PSEU|nr:sensor histidine kinase [Saccharothrix saharensis]TQM79801.1 signal transduction histidine kinase [Saccharothrix saharensis]
MTDEPSREPDWAQWRRPGPGPAGWRDDVWLALAAPAGAAVVTVLINSMGASPWDDGPPLAEQLAWGAALTLPLVARRRYPLTVMFVLGALLIVVQTRQVADNLVPSVALFLAIFSAGAWGQDRARARWGRVAVVVAMFGWLGFGLVKFLLEPAPPFEGAAGPLDPVLATVLYGIGFNVLFFLSAYFFGDMAWVSARRQAELEHRAEQLRRSQEQNTRGAIVAERVRIARDLHDVVAHHVSVMGVQAGAARRVLDRDPGLAREALKTVEETARTAIGELRGLLGVLRADQETDRETDRKHPPTTGETSSPGLDQLPELAEQARSAGLDVAHGVYGEPRPVPEGVALSVYRIVQESLTNVVKHADARKADVRVRFLENSLEVEVADDGRGRGGTPTGAGFGLVGMRERVAVHGGELEAGPRRDAGYRVRARFPA